MSLSALSLVVIAAITHATWNLLAKKAAHAGPAFVAAYTGVAALIYAPAALWAVLRYGFQVTPFTLGCIVASGVLHLAYSLVLQHGYRIADLSVVYPVARGTGPTLSALGAFLLLGETATVGALAGFCAVVGGVLLLATGGWPGVLADRSARAGVLWGGATGGLIAGYTVVDGWGAKVLGIHPVLLDWCANALRLAFLLPTALRDWRGFKARLAGLWLLAAGVGVLAPLGYVLVLTALRLGAPLHVVAPMREMSMMVGALLGMIVLGERVTPARLLGCAMILAGVALLAA